MRIWFRQNILIALTTGLAALPTLAWAAPADVQNPATAASPPPPAPVPEFVPPRAIPSSAMKNWPVYSDAARQAHREGIVLLSIKISAQGAPLDIKVARSSTFPDLDLAAVAAVRNWQFTPAMRDGAAIETTVNLPINFSLKTAEPPAAAASVTNPAAAKPQDRPKPKPKVAVQKPAPKPKPETAKPETAEPETNVPVKPAEALEPAKEVN